MRETCTNESGWLRSIVIACILFSVGFLNAQVKCDDLPANYTGECDTYNDRTGYRSTLSFKDGIPHGKSEQFYRGGQMRYQAKYKNGLMHGKFMSYYETGDLMTQGSFKAGTGTFVIYHMNGEKSVKGSFNAGRPEGVWLSYNEKGFFKDSLKCKNADNKSMLSYLLRESRIENRNFDFFSDMFGGNEWSGNSFFGGDVDSIFIQLQTQMEDVMRQMQEQFKELDFQGSDTTFRWEQSDSTGNFHHFEYFDNGLGGIIKSAKPDGFVNFPDVEPTFKGGELARDEYVKNNLKYPAEAIIAKEQGTVFVEIVVTEDGKVQDSKVVLGLSKVLNDEALRIVREMPKWNPAIHAGESVKSSCIVPIVFSLD